MEQRKITKNKSVKLVISILDIWLLNFRWQIDLKANEILTNKDLYVCVYKGEYK